MSSNLFWSKRADRSKLYCVYVITYKGNTFAPFYVGSGTVSKILDTKNPYIGSVNSAKYPNKLWKKENKESPERFRMKILFTFDDRREASNFEEEILVHFNAKRNSLFTNRNNSAKSFATLPGKDHHWASDPEKRKKVTENMKKSQCDKRGERNGMFLRKHSEESIKLMSQNSRGERNGMFGVKPHNHGKPLSKEGSDAIKRSAAIRKKKWEFLEKNHPGLYSELRKTMTRSRNLNSKNCPGIDFSSLL